MSKSMLATQLTIPTGGWTFAMSVTGLGGTSVRTVAAGNYFPSELLAAVEAQLEAGEIALGGIEGYAVSFNSTTGLVDIEHDSATNFAISTWGSTNLRDALGFAGTLSGASVYTGTLNQQGVWLSQSEGAFTYGNGDEGHTETDMSSTESPRGDVKGLVYNTRQVLPSALWSHVPKASARIAAETTTGASFESWWRKTQGGELSYFEVLAPVRLIFSIDAPSTYKTYRIPGRNGTEMPRTVEDWAGLFRIELNRLVRVPGT